MRRSVGVHRRALLRWAIALAAAAVLALAAGHASANRFSLSTQDFYAAFTPLTLRGVEGGSSFTIDCNVTLDGSFEARTFSIRSPVEVGVIETAVLGSCDAEGVRVSFLSETLPWTISWASYSGSLPNIEAIVYELRGMRILIEAAGLMDCLYRSTQATPATFRWSLVGGSVTDAAMSEEAPVALLNVLIEEDFLICPEALELSGDAVPVFTPPPGPLSFSLI